MRHADPWDEVARLERQMEAELLAQLDKDLRRGASQGLERRAAQEKRRGFDQRGLDTTNFWTRGLPEMPTTH